MFRDGGNYWDVFLGISRVKKGHWTARPLGISAECEVGEGKAEGDHWESDSNLEQTLELLCWQIFTDKFYHNIGLHSKENAVRGQMLRRLDSIEGDEGNCHSQYGAKYVEHAVGNVDFPVELVGKNDTEYEDGDNVDDKRVATPGSHHVEVLEGA